MSLNFCRACRVFFFVATPAPSLGSCRYSKNGGGDRWWAGRWCVRVSFDLLVSAFSVFPCSQSRLGRTLSFNIFADGAASAGDGAGRAHTGDSASSWLQWTSLASVAAAGEG